MARCGWCNQTGLELTSEGTLEVHHMTWAKKTCRGQDNPSLILVRHRAEIAMPTNRDESAVAARTMRDRADHKSKTRALGIASRKNHVTVVRNRSN